MFFSMGEELEYLLRIVLSVICGACIGYERESRLKTAGIRTHIIVSLGSALMMLISKYGFADVLGGDIKLDPSRIAAGIVTAVGFIGAGVIFVRNQTVSGVTTAAGIWATVGIGMALGSGMYVLGVAATALLVVLQLVLHRNHRILRPYLALHLTLELEQGEDACMVLQELFAPRKVKIADAEASENIVRVTVFVPNCYTAEQLLTLYRGTDCIKRMEF